MGPRRSRTAAFIGGAVVTLIAMLLTTRRARHSPTPSGELPDPEPEVSNEASSPGREAEQSFWNKHTATLLSLVGVVVAALIAATVTLVGTLQNRWQQERSGQQQYQVDLVLRALEPDEVDEREEQLRFLLDTRLLTDGEIREGLTAYLNGSQDLPQFDRRAQELSELARRTRQAMQSAALELPCHPSYEPCVPDASDADCLGSSGDGPAYADQVTVIGPDVFGLDPDGDGIGCES